MSLTLLHTADVHLGTRFPSLGEAAQQRGKDFLETFSKISHIALEKKVDALLIAGDLFDSPHPTPTVFGRVKAEFEKLIEAHIPIVLIPGTHDNIMASDNIYRHPFFEHIHLFKDPILKEPKTLLIRTTPLYLYGMAYHPDISKADTSNHYLKNLKRRDDVAPGVHVGLLHGSLAGSPDWKIYAKDFPFQVEDLAALNLDYCALGHYHNRTVYHHNGKIVASYPGTPEGKRFRESGPRYVHLLEFDEKNVLTLTPIAVNTKTLIEKEVDLFTLPADISLTKELMSMGSETILARITLKGLIEDVLDIEKLHADLAPYFAHLEIVDKTSLLESQWVQRLEKENTIRGFFVRKMKEKIESLHTPEEQEVYRTAFKEILSEFQKRA